MPTKKKRKAKKQSRLRELTRTPVSSELCRQAALTLKHAHDSASSMLKAFDLVRAERGSPVGMTTDEEQDLLRAMLVMAAAGLDAMVKQLIRDSLPKLVEIDSDVRKGLEKFVERRIRNGGEDTDVLGGRTFLARVLAAPEQQRQVIEEYIKELTGGSLQSPNDIMRTASALGVPKKSLGIDLQKLKRIFDIRNKIIHELDIDLKGERRKRNIRRRADMMDYANALLKTAENMRDAVDTKLAVSTGEA